MAEQAGARATGASSGGAATTLRDYLTEQATTLGVPPELALAMVQTESGGRQSATSPKGALGLFQLMPETAAELGVDPSDPVQNIDGGLRYFKQQLDAHDGDVRLALAAYNAGPGAVADAGGAIPNFPETQDYVQRVLRGWQGGNSAPAGAAAGVVQPGAPTQAGQPPETISFEEEIGTPGVPTTGAPVTPPESPGLIRRAAGAVAESFDPRAFEGRVNLAATAGGVAAGLATRNPRVGMLTRAGIAPWLTRVIGPPAAAGLASGAEATAEVAIGTAPEGTNPMVEGAKQAAYDVLGQTFFWPIRRVANAALGTKVARQAGDALDAGLKDARHAGRTAIDAVQARVREATEAMRLLTGAADAGVKGRAAAGAGELATGTLNRGATRRTATALNHLVDRELRDAGQLAELTKVYDDLLADAPGRIGTGETASATLRGPTKAALDMAGQRVTAASEAGPPIKVEPIKDTIDEFVEAYRPAEIFGGMTTEAAEAVPIAARATGTAPGNVISIEEYRKLVDDAGSTQNPQRLAGVIGKLQDLDVDEIPFEVAHKVKMLLDESVNWDRRAKRHMEKITKGLRRALRGEMAGFAPYDQATASYSALIPLHTKGVGQRVMNLARQPDGAAKLASMLQSGDPAEAAVLRDLLVDQAAAGGNPEMGQRAWDAVREVYTSDHLIKGGIDGLADRVRTLAIESPEFTATVYNDIPAQKALTNLERLGTAYTQFMANAGEARALGKSAVEGAGRRDIAATRETARQSVESARALREAYQQSSISPKDFEMHLADTIRFLGLGPSSVWGALSAVRLLGSSKADDVLRWAAYSDANTQRLIGVIQGTWPERAMVAGVRGAGEASGAGDAVAPEVVQLFTEMAPFMGDDDPPAETPEP